MILLFIKARLDFKPLFRDHPSEFGKGLFSDIAAFSKPSFLEQIGRYDILAQTFAILSGPKILL